MNAQPAPGIDGRVRAVIERVTPSVDEGRFPVKRVLGERVVVEADCFADGHDAVVARLRWRRLDRPQWTEVPMVSIGNDRWRGAFEPDCIGRWVYGVCAWVDRFLSWRHDFARRVELADLRLAARSGAGIVAEAAVRARTAGAEADARRLDDWARAIARAAGHAPGADEIKAIALDADLAGLAASHPDRSLQAVHPIELPLVVDPALARFSSWYEFFPRSASREPGRHGTFRDCRAWLPYVARMGFDVLYFPPIHPVGRVNRKGRNNTLQAASDDVGSPWAIGAREGGHKAVHAPLGTLADFEALVGEARALGIEIALDIALQCAPDHPYVTTRPGWFRRRPDGSVQYAENPPKKYQDIYPFDFESDEWADLWQELHGVFGFWVARGVRIFRVDNPHTKSFGFWEWAIERLKDEHPEVLFLSEAFTRPKVMHRLAKLGFSQSYTYFAWRNTKREIADYFTELAHGPGREYLRPNAWPNTPDILTEALQFGGRPVFMSRIVLAATLSASYGIYGPAFEHLESAAREPGGEEYLDSEKYQIRDWNLERPDSLAPFIARINQVRRENAALHANDSLVFLPIDNDQMIAYAKATPALDNVIVCVVNLDPHHVQSGWISLDAAPLGIDPSTPYQMHDQLSDAHFLWQGERNFVRLDPQRCPAHVFRVRRRLRTEHDFDYFL
ncbi:MAG: alpha-1,4-glucan--maltose-1-phosphate maltosyltransferase [Gammaproteobacteria bacterium]